MVDLRRLADRLPARPLTRFAPSPTGYLHLGHVVNALHVWGIARALGGRVLLRIEDHDRMRCRPEYEAALLEDLAWLGFMPDELAPRQSESSPAYEDALRRLGSAQHVYACDCSRRTIASETEDVFGEETRYPGFCRTKNLALTIPPFRPRLKPRLGALPPALGIRVEITPGTESFDDVRLGVRRQEPERQCGDLLLRDRLGHWTYQFAVTVDDVRQGIDLVIRGEDLIESTGRQIRLARMLGREEPPVFLHHALIRKPGGAKLSKASGDTGVRDLRASGMSATEVLREAAHQGGVPPELAIVPS